jgi:hypothetical protein
MPGRFTHTHTRKIKKIGIQERVAGCCADDEEFNSVVFVPLYFNILPIFLCWNDVRDDERDPAIGFISERAHFDAHGKVFLLLFFYFLFSLSTTIPPNLYLFWVVCVLFTYGE